jgi:hypothetical protein
MKSVSVILSKAKNLGCEEPCALGAGFFTKTSMDMFSHRAEEIITLVKSILKNSEQQEKPLL